LASSESLPQPTIEAIKTPATAVPSTFFNIIAVILVAWFSRVKHPGQGSYTFLSHFRMAKEIIDIKAFDYFLLCQQRHICIF
jgi:hypothetical protein